MWRERFIGDATSTKELPDDLEFNQIPNYPAV